MRQSSRRSGPVCLNNIPRFICHMNERGISDDGPSNEVILERAMTFGRSAMFTVALQHRRLRTREPEDGTFISDGRRMRSS